MAGGTDPKAEGQALVVTLWAMWGVSVFYCYVANDPQIWWLITRVGAGLAELRRKGPSLLRVAQRGPLSGGWMPIGSVVQRTAAPVPLHTAFPGAVGLPHSMADFQERAP